MYAELSGAWQNYFEFHLLKSFPKIFQSQFIFMWISHECLPNILNFKAANSINFKLLEENSLNSWKFSVECNPDLSQKLMISSNNCKGDVTLELRRNLSFTELRSDETGLSYGQFYEGGCWRVELQEISQSRAGWLKQGKTEGG